MSMPADILPRLSHPMSTSADILPRPSYPMSASADILPGLSHPMSASADILPRPSYPMSASADILPRPSHPMSTSADILPELSWSMGTLATLSPGHFGLKQLRPNHFSPDGGLPLDRLLPPSKNTESPTQPHQLCRGFFFDVWADTEAHPYDRNGSVTSRSPYERNHPSR